MPLLIVDEIAPRKKKPIINHINLSNPIEKEKAWPDFIISLRGSSGFKFFLMQLFNYMSKEKTFKKNLQIKIIKKIRSLKYTKKFIQCYLQ